MGEAHIFAISGALAALAGVRVYLTVLRGPVGAFPAAAAPGAGTVTLGDMALAFSHPWLALALVLGLVASAFIGVAWLAKRLVRGIIGGQGTQRTS